MPKRRLWLSLVTAAAGLVWSPRAAGGQDATPPSASGEAHAQAEEIADAQMIWPTLGRPAFVAPGESLHVVARMPRSPQTPVFTLVWSRPPQRRHLLSAGDGAAERLAQGQRLAIAIPARVPPGTYDLEIRWGASALVARHCVAVGRVAERIRLVHLSNMNVGDVGTPGFDARLVEEVNLVSPTLIVASGDYVDATHPDPARGWSRLVGFLTRFEAPTLLACGDHDDVALYSRLVAPSPIGVVKLGTYRGIVLLDHADHPVHEDPAQLAWVERELNQPADKRLTFVVSHDESPNLLRHWQAQGTLTRMIEASRLGLWFSGGHRDWDGQEYGTLVAAAAPMMFLRTHESSRAAIEGAEGISHYRVVDVVGSWASVPREIGQSGPPPSIAVGRLRAEIDGANDGTQKVLSVTATNNLPYRMDGLALRLMLRAAGTSEPWCQGATLESALQVAGVWDCRIRFDLPDKGSLRAVVGTGPAPPQVNVGISVELPQKLHVTPQQAPEGLCFFSAPDVVGLVRVKNASEAPVTVTPLVRLDGDRLAYRPANATHPFATAYRVRLDPGEQLALELDLSAIRVRPGRRELQVYLKDAPAWAPQCYPLEVTVTPQGPVAGTGKAR